MKGERADVTPPQTELALDDINLGDPDFWLRDDVDGAVRALQRERPICWNEHAEAGRGFWNVLRHADLNEVSRTVQLFSSREGSRLYHDPDTNLVRPSTSSMAELDDPEHRRSRRIIGHAFTPKRVSELREDIERIARRLVDEIRSEGEVDFVTHVSHVLPIEVMCNLLGVPEEDRDHVYGLGSKAMGDQDPELGISPGAGAQASVAIKAYGRKLADERRARPTEDIYSQTANTVLDGDRLTDEEMGAYFSLLITAGNETTSNGLSQGMRAFSLFPGEQQRYLDDPEGTERSMVDEILRWATPTKHLRRVVQQDCTFRGIRFREGDKVVQWLYAGNRDETVFEAPWDFDITRKPNPQISFGSGGPHFCLGAHLARMELTIMFKALFSAFPRLHVSGEVRLLRSTIFSGIKSMPVAWNT